MLYLIIGIGVFAVLFPNLFDFVVSILSFFWNLIGTVIMFFVGLLSHLDLGFLGDGLAFVLRTLGTLLSPILSILPDSPFIPLIPLAVLIVMYFILDDSNGRLDEGVFDFSVKLMYAWCFSAINLGMMAGASGHPLRSLSGVLESYFTPYPINLLNFPEWHPFPQLMLVLLLLGGTLTSLIFGYAGGLRAFFRTWVIYAFCGVLGYAYMVLRLPLFGWLGERFGFIGRLLNIPVGFLEVIVLIQFFLGIVVFLMPMGTIAALNESREAREKARRDRPAPAVSRHDTSDEPETPMASIPVYVSDDDGNHYRVDWDDPYIYIDLPGGRGSVKWEYVQGQPYFYLNGTRFYPHS